MSTDHVYKMVFVVIASPSKQYNAMKEILMKFMNSYDNIKTFFIYGKVDKSTVFTSDNDLYFDNVKESLRPGILDKTVLALKHIDEHYKYEYIMRTNLSSFFVMDRLMSYVDTLPKDKCLTGVIYNNWPRPFTSGAGTIMSADVARYLYQNAKGLIRSHPDDVAMGYLLVPVFGIHIPCDKWRFDYDEHNPVKLDDDSIIPDDYFHFRLKNRNRDLDVHNMKVLYEYFYK